MRRFGRYHVEEERAARAPRISSAEWTPKASFERWCAMFFGQHDERLCVEAIALEFQDEAPNKIPTKKIGPREFVREGGVARQLPFCRILGDYDPGERLVTLYRKNIDTAALLIEPHVRGALGDIRSVSTAKIVQEVVILHELGHAVDFDLRPRAPQRQREKAAQMWALRALKKGPDCGLVGVHRNEAYAAFVVLSLLQSAEYQSWAYLSQLDPVPE